MEASLTALVGLWLWALGVQVSEAVATAGLVICAIGVVASGRARVRDARHSGPGDRWLWFSLLLFVAWSLIAWPNGTGLVRTLHWLGIPVAALALTQVSAPGRRALAIGVGTALAFSVLAAGLQHFGIWPPLSAFEAWRWTRTPFERVYESLPGAEDRFMGGGLIFHRLKFAHVAGLAALWLVAWGRQARGALRWAAWSVAAAAWIATAVFALARAAAVCTAVGLLALLLIWAWRSPAMRRPVAIAVGVGLLLFVGLLGNPAFRTRLLSTGTAEGNGDRAFLLRAGWRAVCLHPLTGAGPGRFRVADFAEPETPQHVLENAGKAHNQFLSIAAETGIPGLLLFLVLLAALLRRFVRTETFSPESAASVVYFVALSLTHDPLFQAPFSLALMLALGVGLSKFDTLAELAIQR